MPSSRIERGEVCGICSYLLPKATGQYTCPECGAVHSTEPISSPELRKRFIRVRPLLRHAVPVGLFAFLAIFVPSLFNAIEDDDPWQIELMHAAFFFCVTAPIGIVFGFVTLGLLYAVERVRCRLLAKTGIIAAPAPAGQTRFDALEMVALVVLIAGLLDQLGLVALVVIDFVRSSIVRLENPGLWWPFLLYGQGLAVAAVYLVSCATYRLVRAVRTLR